MTRPEDRIDEDGHTVCGMCGETLESGAWPFCPHGVPGKYSNIKDDIPGGVVLENYGPEPITVYSHSERRAIMKARGLTEFVRHTGVPGTDKSPYTTDWSKGSIDPYTLEAARTLVERVHGGKTPEPETDPLDTMDESIRPFNLTGDDQAAIEVIRILGIPK